MRNTKSDHDRLATYVAGFFARHQRTEWPTIKYAAKALRWTQRQVEEAIEGDPQQRMFTSSHFADDLPCMHFVELHAP